MERKAKVITTDYQKKIFWKMKEMEMKSVDCMNLAVPYPECAKQTMEGFGGAFTEAAAYCYSKLPSGEQHKLLEAYFGQEGLRYSIGRTHINSCDFALSNYAVESDVNGQNFELEREEQYIFPFMRDAYEKRNGDMKLLVSPWSPPAYMKTNGEMNHGGKLKKSCKREWALYIARYIKEMESKGFDIQYLTVQNEPDAVQSWDSCTYTALEERDFVRDYLGPVLKEKGLEQVKIIIWDHNKEAIYERAKGVLEDQVANQYVYGVGVHWYTGDHFQAIALIKEKYPDKAVFFTEGCVEYSRFADSGEVAKAEMYAHDMIGNFANGVSAFYDWNLILDADGGPNHVGNFCAAPVMCNEDFTQWEKRLSYYYIGHMSRYVKPGAKMIPLSTYCAEAEGVAFVNPDGERVIVLLNRQNVEIPVTIAEKGTGIDMVLEPHSIVTVCYL